MILVVIWISDGIDFGFFTLTPCLLSCCSLGPPSSFEGFKHWETYVFHRIWDQHRRNWNPGANYRVIICVILDFRRSLVRPFPLFKPQELTQIPTPTAKIYTGFSTTLPATTNTSSFASKIQTSKSNSEALRAARAEIGLATCNRGAEHEREGTLTTSSEKKAHPQGTDNAQSFRPNLHLRLLIRPPCSSPYICTCPEEKRN